MRHTFKRGKTYLADVRLGLGEMGYGNEMLAQVLSRMGFADTEVRGGGAVRHLKGRWAKDDTALDLPDEITDVREAE